MSELAKLRRRVRALVVVCLILAALGISRWVFPPAPAQATKVSEADLDGFRQRVSRVGRTQRLRMLQRVVRAGGQRAVARVIEMLRGARTIKLRLAAIEQLGHLGGPESARELASVVEDEDPRLARAAIVALGHSGCHEASERLIELLGDDTSASQRAAAIAALGELGDDAAVTQLLRLAADPDERARETAISALGQTGNAKAVTLLTRLARDRALRTHAISALGSLGVPAAKKSLITLARRGDIASRVAAIAALGDFADPEVQVLLASLTRSTQPRIAKAALKTLGDAVTPLAQEALKAAVKSPRQELRLAAAKALAKTGDPEGQEALIDLVGQGREGAEAAQELAKLGTPAAREALVALATDGASATQSHAIEALAKLKGSEVDEALDRLRKTASPTIASRALTQLAKRRGKAALPMLKEAFTEGSVALRRSALRAMSQLNDPKLQELLIKTATSTSDYALRATSVSALARLGTPQAQNALVSMFKTGDRNLRSTAAQTLATMNNAKARDALLNAIKKGEGRVSYALRNAIGQLRDPASRRRLHEMLDDPAVKNAAKTEVIAALALQQDTAGILAVAESHPNIALRQKALVQLGQLGGANAERTLIDATAGDPKTRDAAIRGLAKLASPRAIETLGQALHNPETFKQATAALARDGRKEALSALRESFRGGSKREREIIVAKLGRTPPSPAAKKMLFTALNDPNDRVAYRAVMSLNRHGNNHTRDRLFRQMESSNRPALRRSIAYTLRWSNGRYYKTHKEAIDDALRRHSDS